MKIKEYRKALGLTQKQFSELFNPPIPIDTIKKWNNKKKYPKDWVEGLIIEKLKHMEESKMKWIVKFEGEILGMVTTNNSMTDEEICEAAGVELAHTQDEYEHSPENGKYDLDELEIVEEK